MTTTDIFAVTKTKQSRLSETDFNNLEFGKYIADHMLVADFKDGKCMNQRLFLSVIC